MTHDSSRTWVRRTGAAAAILTLGVGLVACTDDSKPEPTASRASSTPGSAPTSVGGTDQSQLVLGYAPPPAVGELVPGPGAPDALKKVRLSLHQVRATSEGTMLVYSIEPKGASTVVLNLQLADWTAYPTIVDPETKTGYVPVTYLSPGHKERTCVCDAPQKVGASSPYYGTVMYPALPTNASSVEVGNGKDFKKVTIPVTR